MASSLEFVLWFPCIPLIRLFSFLYFFFLSDTRHIRQSPRNWFLIQGKVYSPRTSRSYKVKLIQNSTRWLDWWTPWGPNILYNLMKESGKHLFKEHTEEARLLADRDVTCVIANTNRFIFIMELNLWIWTFQLFKGTIRGIVYGT